MTRLGMDVDAVERIGRGLQSDAEAVGALTTRIETVVGRLSSVWQGEDAQRFVGQWWPEHRTKLRDVQKDIHGLGQSALNNAAEQRQVSGESTATGSQTTAAPRDAAVTPEPPTVATSAPVTAASVTAWGNGVVGHAFDVDHSDGVQCVDLVEKYSSDTLGVPGSVSGIHGNANEIYGNASSQYFDKIPAGGNPQPGDIVCIGPNAYSKTYGHVAVVESVDSKGIHVIEQSGAQPERGTFRGTVSSIEVAAIQGYLRPRS